MLSAKRSSFWRPLIGIIALLLIAVSRAKGSDWHLFSPHPYPFLGSIQQKSGTWKNICGCSLIKPNWALTSADCALATKSTEARIVFNALDISQDSKDRKLERRIDKIVVHPSFDLSLNANNIALIKLQKEVLFQPALLHYDDLNPQGEESNVLIMGWGDTNVGSNGTNWLQEAKVHLKPPADCEVQYENFDRNTQLCIGDPERGVSACSGDMGGPVLLNRTLIGVMTTVDSQDCLKKNTVAVRVGAFRGFIQEVTKG